MQSSLVVCRVQCATLTSFSRWRKALWLLGGFAECACDVGTIKSVVLVALESVVATLEV